MHILLRKERKYKKKEKNRFLHIIPFKDILP